MHCYKCGKENLPDASFCVECGNQFRGEKVDYYDVNKDHYVQTIGLFLCVVLIIVTALVTHLPLLQHEFLFHGLLLGTIVAFAAKDFKGFAGLFRFTFHLKPILLIVCITPLLAAVVAIVAGFLNTAIGAETESLYVTYMLNTPNMYLYGIVFVAILPGLLEEFLFRGILFNHLLKLTTPRITILITGILFAFVHFSVFSLLWLLPIGLFLGYLRLRYRSIFYSIFFHIFYNASIFFIEMIIPK